MKAADIFDNAQLYKLFQFSVSKSGAAHKISNEVLKPNGIKTVLDFGCGIGYHSNEFPDAEYLGIEPLQGCIDKANKTYGSSSAKFIVGDHNTLKSIPTSSYDLIIAIGVLHHIDDHIFTEFLKESYRILKPGGRLTTFDPVFHENQKRFSRWLVSRDRGLWVRTPEKYLFPIKNVFPKEPTFKIYSSLLRIPYDHIHLEIYK